MKAKVKETGKVVNLVLLCRNVERPDGSCFYRADDGTNYRPEELDFLSVQEVPNLNEQKAHTVEDILRI